MSKVDIYSCNLVFHKREDRASRFYSCYLFLPNDHIGFPNYVNYWNLTHTLSPTYFTNLCLWCSILDINLTKPHLNGRNIISAQLRRVGLLIFSVSWSYVELRELPSGRRQRQALAVSGDGDGESLFIKLGKVACASGKFWWGFHGVDGATLCSHQSVFMHLSTMNVINYQLSMVLVNFLCVTWFHLCHMAPSLRCSVCINGAAAHHQSLADHTGHLWLHPSASPAVILWKSGRPTSISVT